MMFLLRAAFWLGVVLVLLPSGGGKPDTQSQLSAVEAVSAATAAVSDMGRFCDRQPAACEVGSQAAVALGQRAQAGAKMLLDFLHERNGGADTGATGSIDGAPTSIPASQNTLRPADLAPAWRGPAARKDV